MLYSKHTFIYRIFHSTTLFVAILAASQSYCKLLISRICCSRVLLWTAHRLSPCREMVHYEVTVFLSSWPYTVTVQYTYTVQHTCTLHSTTNMHSTRYMHSSIYMHNMYNIYWLNRDLNYYTQYSNSYNLTVLKYFRKFTNITTRMIKFKVCLT